jgi:peptidoglycan/LPS O-acetylase OafA/YrhL
MHGYYWVVVFFILSGFVLPARFFATGNKSCIFGGTFRRYLRLMIPLWVIISIYYFVVKIGFVGPQTFKAVKKKNFLQMIIDGTIGTWVGNTDYTFASWTLTVELIASFFIYLIANTIRNY